jgi:hypothetical protein
MSTVELTKFLLGKNKRRRFIGGDFKIYIDII